MSIEMENPETTIEKIDAAHNYVAQIRIAMAIGDHKHVMDCVEKASQLLFDALIQIQDDSDK